MPSVSSDETVPIVALVVLNWNGFVDTLECLASLRSPWSLYTRSLSTTARPGQTSNEFVNPASPTSSSRRARTSVTQKATTLACGTHSIAPKGFR